MREEIEGLHNGSILSPLLAAEWSGDSTLGGVRVEEGQEKQTPGFHKTEICNLPNKVTSSRVVAGK